MQRVFETGRTGRYSTGSLVREGYTTILTHGGGMTYRDFVLSGTPGQQDELLLEIGDEYEGEITLEHVHLKSPNNTPCIRIAPGCDVTLVLTGDNALSGGGIEVPEGAKLTVQGDGNLAIRLKGNDYCGIGNINGNAGTIDFYQDGTVNVEANGLRGIAIGGGSGADIHICRGRYMITQHGDQGVGIGCVDGDAALSIKDCEIDMTQSYVNGCAIGSFKGDVSIEIRTSYIHSFGGATSIVGIGTVLGEKAEIRLFSLAMDIDIRAQEATGIGSLSGDTTIYMDSISYRYSANGKMVLAYGAPCGKGGLDAMNSDISLRIRSDAGRESMFGEENCRMKDCRFDLIMNGNVIRKDQ